MKKKLILLCFVMFSGGGLLASSPTEEQKSLEEISDSLTAEQKKALIEELSSLSQQDKDSRLIMALIDKNLPQMQYLVKAGADVNAKTLQGDTILSFALQQKKSPEIINWLKQNHGLTNEQLKERFCHYVSFNMNQDAQEFLGHNKNFKINFKCSNDLSPAATALQNSNRDLFQSIFRVFNPDETQHHGKEELKQALIKLNKCTKKIFANGQLKCAQQRAIRGLESMIFNKVPDDASDRDKKKTPYQYAASKFNQCFKGSKKDNCHEKEKYQRQSDTNPRLPAQ